MKKILVTLMVLIGWAVTAEAQVRFTDAGTDAVRREAMAQNKLVLIDLYATWCGPCKMMEREVFSQPAVGEFIHARFVPAKYDIDKPTGRALAEEYGVRSIPTYLVFNTEGELLGKLVGAMPAEELIEALGQFCPTEK